MGSDERWVLRSGRDNRLMLTGSPRDPWTSNIRDARKFESFEKAQEYYNEWSQYWVGEKERHAVYIRRL